MRRHSRFEKLFFEHDDCSTECKQPNPKGRKRRVARFANILISAALFGLMGYLSGMCLASTWRMNQLVVNFLGSLASLLVTAMAIVFCGIAPLVVRISTKLAARGRHNSMKP